MVDMVATNEKLRRRAVRMLREITGVSLEAAQTALAASLGRVKTAVVSLETGLAPEAADAALALHGGSLRATLAALRS